MLILDRRMLLQAGSAAVGAAELAPTVPALARARWKLKVRLRGSEIRKIIMNLCNLPPILSKGTILILSSSIAVYAANTFSDADKAFVAKVSQGGMYEVELGKVAETKAVAQDVKDQGNTEAHDHTLVGEKLKSIVEANGMEFPKQLNTEFQARLDKIGALPADKFDAAYIEDMKKFTRQTELPSPRKRLQVPIPI